MALLDEVDGLLAAVAAGADNADVGRRMQALADEHARAAPGERAVAIERLGEVVMTDAWVRRAGVAALAGGALVELGAPPEPLAGPTLGRLGPVLVAARRFVDAVLARAGDEELTEGYPLDGRVVRPEHVRATLEADREGGDAYFHLRHWCLPSITLLSLAPVLRQFLAADLQGPAEALAGCSPFPRFLAALCRVLDDAPVLVLEPGRARGWRVRIGGIADNFQLQTLLQGALAEHGACPPPSPEALRAARGEGPQDSGRRTLGVWGMYDGRAVACFEGPVPQDLWIWGEAPPADIPLVAGERVIVLAEAAIPRAWPAIRVFEHLPAYVRVESVLSPDEVAAAVSRIAGGDA